MTLGKRIKELREKSGMLQRELSHQCKHLLKYIFPSCKVDPIFAI